MMTRQKKFLIYFIVIKALAKIGDYSLCKQIIEHIPQTFLVNDRIQKLLIDMWGKVGCVEKSKEIFVKQPRHDQFGYTAMSEFNFVA